VESKDVRFRVGEETFRLRAAAVILEKGKLLVAKNQEYDAFYTIGGGIHLGESAEEAAVREAFEETGLHYQIDRLLYIQERFFEHGGDRKHEIVFYYLMKEQTSGIPEGIPGDYPGEILYWLPLENLEQYNILPGFLKTALNSMPERVCHIVSREFPN